MPADVEITPDANRELQDVPLPIQARVVDIFERLAKWPEVSGAKPMRKEFKRSFRIRTGAYRVIFRVSPDGQTVTVWRIGYRGDVYDD